jgi:hypothetical protein
VQGALLLLLFRASHQLEDRLTEKAAGSLQRLFDSVPDRAVVVEVQQGSNAPQVATSQEVCVLLLLLLLLARVVTQGWSLKGVCEGVRKGVVQCIACSAAGTWLTAGLFYCVCFHNCKANWSSR